MDFSLLFLVKLSLLILLASFLVSVLCFFFDCSLSKVIALPTIAIAFKSVKERQLWKGDNYMGSNTEKKPWTNLQNSYKNWCKEIKSDNFCHRKVGRAITKLWAIFKGKKIISHFDGSNNIFTDCTCPV